MTSPTCQVPAEIARLKGEPAVLAALATGSTVENAAAAGDVTERTVYRRLADDGYRDAIDTHRREALDRALGRLADEAAGAVAVLAELMRDADTDAARIRAADRLLRHVRWLREHADHEDRIAELEELLADVERDQPAGAWPLRSVGR